MPLSDPQSDSTYRAAWMRVLALAPWSDLQAHAQGFADTPHDTLRAPETGLVMLRGRMGATGAAFNFGEATVTRCTIRLADGTEGHAYVLGRNGSHARLAAVCDALLQQEHAHDGVTRSVILPLEENMRLRHAEVSAKAAATKVDFFTMVRGDD